MRPNASAPGAAARETIWRLVASLRVFARQQWLRSGVEPSPEGTWRATPRGRLRSFGFTSSGLVRSCNAGSIEPCQRCRHSQGGTPSPSCHRRVLSVRGPRRVDSGLKVRVTKNAMRQERLLGLRTTEQVIRQSAVADIMVALPGVMP
jgi:hypothetical protein